MKCAFCHALIPEKSKFCPECGQKHIVVQEEQKVKEIPPILMVEEAAELLRVSKSMFYELLALPNDPVPWFPIGKHKRFITEELLAWAKRNQVRYQLKQQAS